LWISPQTDFKNLELDEVHWFIETRKCNNLGVNTYISTVVSRVPRQIVAFEVGKSVNSADIQQMVNDLPPAENYFTDGGYAYLGVDFYPGTHRRNIHNKNDTHIVESTNCDLRHHIGGLRRRSRIFFRKRENLKLVLTFFIDAYNKFGDWKFKHQKPVKHKPTTIVTNKHHKNTYPTVSVLDFLCTT
jgi:IS1 family transposase